MLKYIKKGVFVFAANFIPAATNRCSLGEHDHGRDYGPLVSHIGAPENRECVYHTQCLANRVINNNCPECGLALNSNSIEKFKAKVTPLYAELKQAQEQADADELRQQQADDRAIAEFLQEGEREEVARPIEDNELPLNELEHQEALQAQRAHDRRRRVNDPDVRAGRELQVRQNPVRSMTQYIYAQSAFEMGARLRSRFCPNITVNRLNVIIWSAVVIAFVARNYF